MSVVLDKQISGVLADRLSVGKPQLITDTGLVLAGALLVGILAQVSIPLWPVPITGQTLGVSLVGVALGARRGALSLATYALLGVAGVPWFANFGGGPAYLLKPSFGYILGFIAVAWLVGYFAERGWDRTVLRSFFMFFGTSLVIFFVGVHYLWMALNVTGVSTGYLQAWMVGFVPFLIGDVIKCAIAAGLAPAAWKLVNHTNQ
ncbi:biotin transporter BioY [Gleimia sp. 6138-11-ORH1]|uniref:biotin transporter BioY n=1 Tax=Gleimia sp. 6138-11-ORH1 TaxID=2973937 RepID=UPI00216918F7|nr:biotin transporter BioY [Gleimia sp. 6138-11-ORH1]MCS4484612.1 biotin transporter BioY [Gleimia sp. 6138-11-ORH1]